MQPIFHACYLNQYLADRGWLAFNANGTVNWDETQAALHPAENGTLMLRPTADGELLRREIIAFFAEAGFSGCEIDTLDYCSAQQGFSNSLFLLPPDGVRVKACAADSYVTSSSKAGDHCGFSSHSWLRGTLLTANIDKPQPVMEMYEIHHFMLEA
ncbi:hypothetical protein COO59_16370 [Mixta theicola]|uniref:Uncharacterized protein n=1 Tax=Mixta theicola TaxID=1458355 RepID=A0A2K1Q6U8_9GAMM|nr:hypothetical protein [Mixta theicola]PNS10687.1 hypothetical protein COO59_16370 [Mixta theicola]GLR10923.1 hypothetical protein GCM10007905_36430 [Mixta theicola]